MSVKQIKMQKYIGAVLAFLAEIISLFFGQVCMLYISNEATKQTLAISVFMFLTVPISAIIFLVWNDKKMNPWVYFGSSTIFILVYLFIEGTIEDQILPYKILRFVFSILGLILGLLFIYRKYLDNGIDIDVHVKKRSDQNWPPITLEKKRFKRGIIYMIMCMPSSAMLGVEYIQYSTDKEYEMPLLAGLIMCTFFCLAGIVFIIFKSSNAYGKIMDLDFLIIISCALVCGYSIEKIFWLSICFVVSSFMSVMDLLGEYYQKFGHPYGILGKRKY